MAGSGQAEHLWKEWGVHVLVLFSFAFQVTLLILAEFRRHVASGVLRLFTWLAYQLADVTAIYVLGHMSVTSRSPGHELVAFWAPFLLMHLGGQDNITAYAIEDNHLWLRHLQTLAVQAAAAAYVIYASSILSGRPLMQAATILMFVVGVLKYGERVWVLRCASGSEYGHNYLPSETILAPYKSHYIHYPTSRSATEDIVFLGYELLGVPKDFLKGPVPYDMKFKTLVSVSDWRTDDFQLHVEQAYKVAEMQVSLMYDVFYTKAESQCGWIRIVSSLGTAIALSLLFPVVSGGTSDRHNGGGYNRVDVVITYILSVGAAVLEAVSLLRYILSSFNWYQYERGPQKRREQSERKSKRIGRRVITSLRRLVHAADWRRRHSWSRSMGQHNLLRVCARSKASCRSKVARRMGVEEWCNTQASSWFIPVSPLIEKLVMKQVLERCDHIHDPQSPAAFKWKSQQVYDDLHLSIKDDELSFDKRILLWHIATDLYLRWYKDQSKGASSRQDDDLAEAVEALSNYMLFLVAARPHMLPAHANRKAYINMCYHLINGEYSSAEDLADNLLRQGRDLNNQPGLDNLSRIVGLRTWNILAAGCQLAAKFISEEAPFDMSVLGNVWAEMLCYMGNRCSANSHAKQLSDGGELITVAAFLVEYNKRDMIRASADASLVSSERTNDEEA